MACLTTSLICLLLMASVKSQANISAEAGAGGSNAKDGSNLKVESINDPEKTCICRVTSATTKNTKEVSTVVNL